jgi:hypothetical protein
MSARRCRLRGSRRGAHSDSCVGILRLAIFWNHWARQGAGETVLPLSLSYFLSLFSLPLLRPRSLGIATPPVSSLLYIHRHGVLYSFVPPLVQSCPVLPAPALKKSQTHKYSHKHTCMVVIRPKSAPDGTQYRYFTGPPTDQRGYR